MGHRSPRILSAILLFALIAMLSSCYAIKDASQKKMFSELSESYRKAILWSDFEYASEFLAEGYRKIEKIDPVYKMIKVTAFEEKRKVVDPEVNTVEQVVDIRYFWVDRMVEKSITEHLVWEWDPEAKIWFLISGLPKFD